MRYHANTLRYNRLFPVINIPRLSEPEKLSKADVTQEIEGKYIRENKEERNVSEREKRGVWCELCSVRSVVFIGKNLDV